jgi:hypothetical protein
MSLPVKFVVLDQYSSISDGCPVTLFPGDVIDSAKYTTAEFANLYNTAPAGYVTSYDAPTMKLQDAVAQTLAVRATGGNVDDSCAGIMYRGTLP